MRATLAAFTGEESPPITTPTRVQLQVPPSAPTRTERRKIKSIFQVAPAEASAWELPTPTFTSPEPDASLSEAEPQALL